MNIKHKTRPNIDNNDVYKLLNKYYNLNIDLIQELPSERDRNFHIKSDDKEFILKIYNSMEKQSTINSQIMILEYLKSHTMNNIIPVNIPTIDGKNFAIVNLNDNEHIIRLTNYISGEVLAKVTPHDYKLMYLLGETIAKIDIKLKDISISDINMDFYWDLLNAGTIIQNNIQYVDNPQLITYYLSLFNEIVPKFAKFKKQIIHNDANDYNVIVTPEHRIAIIDFGDMVYSCRIFDLAITIAYAILNKKDPLLTAASIIEGYNSIYPLEPNEIDALFVLISARLAQSVSISAYQKTLEPENKYLVISEKPAWDMLNKLRHISPQFATILFRYACNKDILSEVNAITPYIYKNKLYIVDSTKFKHIDLSVGSLDLGLVENFDNFIDKKIKSKQRLYSANTALVARHNEVRLQYLTDKHRVETDNGYEWSAVHLGVDIFIGGNVYAAYDGVVKYIDNDSIIIEHNIDNNSDKLKFYTLYSHIIPIVKLGNTVKREMKIGEVVGDHLHFQIVTKLLGYGTELPHNVRYAYHKIWNSINVDPTPLFLDNFTSPELDIDEILNYREKLIGKSLSISYSKPLKIVRGYMQYLYDNTGRQYLDAVNNVPHVGHSHPHVVNALKQAGVLNTNTRYLHDNLVKYAKMLTDKFPDKLNVCFFVNSGSEANELALRLAKTYTGNEDVIVLDCAYHGNTNFLIDISPYKFDGPGGQGAKPFVHKTLTPDVYRGKYRGDDAGIKYAQDVRDIIIKLSQEGRAPAAFICESLPGVGGQIVLPKNYFKNAFKYVREANGVCIADEVQVGFGRVGEYFWGFEQQDVIPDIVVLGKPIGNGHPMGAVITTREIADAFNNGMEFFTTTGGNPVSCAVGMAVLEVIENEKLQAHALEVGNYLHKRLEELYRYSIVGDVRGMGLFLGVELVRDKNSLEPADWEAKYIADRMRDHGILISVDGPLHNVLKIKPPLVFTKNNSDFLVDTLHKIFREYPLQRNTK